MKNLILMRHANALPNSFNETDFDRPLSNLGLTEAKQAQKFLNNFDLDKILVSSSLRTKQTLESVIDIKDNEDKIEIIDDLYQASAQDILQLISIQDRNIYTLMILCHNPSITGIALILGDIESNAYEKVLENGIPTSGIVVIEFNNVHWKNISKLMGNITDFFVPKNDFL